MELLSWDSDDTGLLLLGDPSELDEETRERLEVPLTVVDVTG